MINNTEIIAFFSAENFFRLKSLEKQREKFETLKEDFKREFDIDANDNIFEILIQHQNDCKKAKHEREKSRLSKKSSLKVSAGAILSDEHVAQYPPGRYVLTCAQNNTDINKLLFNILLNYCTVNNAKLLIGKVTYNKTGFLQPDLAHEQCWYDPDLTQFLVSGHIALGNNHHFISDANVIPTAKNPLSGFDGATPAGVHAIIPATKIALKVSAALKGAKTKIVTSTGSITKRNYIMRKSGAIASIEHNFGAVFVDTETDTIRHLELMVDSNCIYDLQNCYTVDDCTTNDSVSCVQLGDIHAEKMEAHNLESAIYLIKCLNPANIILHDVMDFSSRNHHNIKDPAFLHEQHIKNNTVAKDIKQVAKIIDRICNESDNAKVHIIESNHDLAINTWLKNSDFRQDPINAITYLQCMLALYKHQERHKNSKFNMLQYVYKHIGNGKNTESVIFHDTDESVKISSIEHGCHGHNGINGSRGSPTSFRTLGIPMNTGHTHAPSICGKVYTSGVTASLDMDYNKGASSWRIAHVVTYNNGQRQLIFM